FGHTWVPKSEDPKIRWTTSKNLAELSQTVSGDVRFYEECARCKAIRGEFIVKTRVGAAAKAAEAAKAEAAEAETTEA
ncbi:MAG: hypothetical protein AAF368_14415, partial [Planctomycetota bacterium]